MCKNYYCLYTEKRQYVEKQSDGTIMKWNYQLKLSMKWNYCDRKAVAEYRKAFLLLKNNS